MLSNLKKEINRKSLYTVFVLRGLHTLSYKFTQIVSCCLASNEKVMVRLPPQENMRTMLTASLKLASLNFFVHTDKDSTKKLMLM